MCIKCQYEGCNKEANKKVTIAELEIQEGKGKGVGYFCEDHAHDVVECGADTIENLKCEHDGCNNIATHMINIGGPNDEQKFFCNEHARHVVKDKEGNITHFYDIDKNIGEPECYRPNGDTHPLCIGKDGDKEGCKHCCLYEDMIEQHDYM